MSNNAPHDLLSLLSNASAARRGGVSSTTTTTTRPLETSILSFKAGKMNATLQPNGKYWIEPDLRRGELHVVWTALAASNNNTSSNTNTTTTNNNNNNSQGQLKLEWKDRRTKTTVNTFPILSPGEESTTTTTTFERIDTGREKDRVYLLQTMTSETTTTSSSSSSRHFFWMQDKDDELDEAHCISVNVYLSDFNEASLAAMNNTAALASPTNTTTTTTTNAPLFSSSLLSSAHPMGGGTGSTRTMDSMDNAELLRIMQGALGNNGNIHDVGGARTTTVPGNASIPTANAGQVDALGNILENLGIPPSTSSSFLGRDAGTPSGERNARLGGGSIIPGGTTTTANAAVTTSARGGLTLADLQGAMAGLATTSPPSATGTSSRPGVGGGGSGSGIAEPPLSELVTMDIVDQSGILENPSTVERLVSLLPENQRSEAMLRENIRSPQVAQCLRRLTSALADEDDAGSFNSIIANFQLNPEDGALAMASGNPIEAFLNCLVRDVERNNNNNNNRGEMAIDENDEAAQNGGDSHDDDDHGDEKMDEN